MPIVVRTLRRIIGFAVVALALLTFPGLASDGRARLGPSTLNAPLLTLIPEVRSADGIASLTLRSALDRNGRPAFFWKGQEVAPTIRVHPGDEIHVHYVNGLPEYCGLGMTSDSNLHFHGLVTSPHRPGDDVLTTSVAPRASFDYVVKIGPREPPGLYWYHPHPHGLTNWQIGNGMSGAIVIEGIAAAVPSLAGLRERIIVLRDIPRDPSVAAAEAPDKLRPTPAIFAGSAVPTLVADEDQQGTTPCGIEGDAQPTINGAPSATLAIRPGERQLWRILNASGHRHYDLAIAGMRILLVAEDGIPLRGYPGGAATQSVDHVLIPPGGRAEIVVAGPQHPQLLLSRCYSAGAAGDVNPAVVFGELVDDRGTTLAARVARVSATAWRPAASIPAPSVRRTMRFGEDARGFAIDGRIYDPKRAPSIVARAGTIEEWTLENDTDEVHAFHLHQVHFAVETTNGIRERYRHWRDVIDLPPQARDARGRATPSRLRVLVDFRDPVVRGTFLVHCHLTDHEDGGMMAKVRVI